MLDKFIFNEDIKRVFNSITNGQIISQFILKNYISDIKIINDNKKMEKNIEINNSKSIGKNNESSQNLIVLNNLSNKTNNSIHPINIINNSFLYLNTSFISLCLEKFEGITIECKWKKKYILLLKIIKVNDIQQFHKSINIECIEMNHYENAFNLDLSFFWNSTELQTFLLIKIISKDKIIEEIITRELNNNDKKIIYDNFCNYLFSDLTNIENIFTSLIFANMKDITLFINDIKNLIKSSPGTDDKRLEFYNSSLINSVQNCRVYDKTNNNLCQEFILRGYYAEKNQRYQLKWEKTINNKPYCISAISIIYLEENISLIIFKNIYQTHITAQMLYEVNLRKKQFFDNLIDYFLKKNNNLSIKHLSPKNNIKEMILKIGIKNYINKEIIEQNDLNMFINNNSPIKNNDKNNNEKEQESQYDSIFQNISNINDSNYPNKNGEIIFNDTIQNLSEIENINSVYFLGLGEEEYKDK